ncbi:organic cation transporter protein-like [Pararge aegeria]|uniref:organic cation transporter protein-like n=1 Tax=Pararge aegeria TaxID=116150 RepID=UPI0019D31965|nr:organic cation transporter protein-like [Pararge aegeria]
MGLFKISPTEILNKEKQQDAIEKKDAVSAIIGDFGRWQLMMTLIIPFFAFPSTFHLYLPTFTTKSTDFWCRRPANLSNLPIEYWINYSQPLDACSVRKLPSGITVESIMNYTAPILDSFQKCTEWDFDRTDVGNTIISEWDLICDNASLTTLAEVAFLISVGVGGVTGGWFSDKFGRKKILMGMIAVQSVLGIICIFVRTFVQYILVRLAMGLVSVSVVYAAFVLSVELVGGRWVTIAGSFNFFPLPLAYIIVSLVSMVLPDWRDIQLAMTIPGPFLLLLWFVIPESPRWLLSSGKIEEAKIILEKAAKFNNRPLDDLDKILTSYATENKSEKPNILMLFKGHLLKRTFCLFIAWFSMNIAYYGLVLNIGKFNLGNLHITSIVLAAVEIPAIALCIPVLLKTGRRTPVFASMIICGIACITSELFAITLDNAWIVILCLMVGKFTISGTNVMLPIYTAELYPTVIRNLGVGATQVAAGLALICIPYLWEMTALNAHLPMSTLALLSIAGGGIILLLPDTKSAADKKRDSAIEVCDGTFKSTDNTP